MSTVIEAWELKASAVGSVVRVLAHDKPINPQSENGKWFTLAGIDSTRKMMILEYAGGEIGFNGRPQLICMYVHEEAPVEIR